MKLLFTMILVAILVQGCGFKDTDDYSYQISQYNIKIQSLGIKYNNDYSKEIGECKTRYVDKYDKESCVLAIKVRLVDIYSNILALHTLNSDVSNKGYKVRGGLEKRIMKCLQGFSLISSRGRCIRNLKSDIEHELLTLKSKKKDST